MWLISKNPGQSFGQNIGGKKYEVGNKPIELPDEIARHFTDGPLPIAFGPKRSDLDDFIQEVERPETDFSPKQKPKAKAAPVPVKAAPAKAKATKATKSKK